jgi:hypothetical protein
MQEQEVVRALRAVRYSSQSLRIGRREPGIRTIAEHAGISYRTLYRILDAGHCTPAQAEALTGAFAAVTRGRDQDRRSP